MANLEGFADLHAKLIEMSSPKEMATTYRSAVRNPMEKVKDKARAGLSRISPGERTHHKTYRGNTVSAGFASRSLRLVVFLDRSGTKATAMLGVRAEAFYALQFHELGTAFIPARPWLAPAFRGSSSQLIAGVGEAMTKRLAKIAKKRKAEAAGAA